MDDLISRLLLNPIRRIVSSTMKEEIDRQLPALVEEITIKAIKSDLNRRLTNVGFGWALGIALQEYWPDLDRGTAIRWLREYIEVPYGTPGYDWTYGAAKEIALQYVSDFGEA